jgi:hypothetical protein
MQTVPYFRLRVLSTFDSKYKLYVAYCLETGNVATAEDHETTNEIMKEILEDEISNAVKFENYANLFSKPAPKMIWDRWNELAKSNKPKTTFLNVKHEKVDLNDEAERSAQIEVVATN